MTKKMMKKLTPLPEVDLAELTLDRVGGYRQELEKARSIKKKLVDEDRGVRELEEQLKARDQTNVEESALAILEDRQADLDGTGALQEQLDEKRARADTLRKALQLEREKLDDVAFKSYGELRQRFTELHVTAVKKAVPLLRALIGIFEEVDKIETTADRELLGCLAPGAKSSVTIRTTGLQRSPVWELDELRERMKELRTWIATEEQKT